MAGSLRSQVRRVRYALSDNFSARFAPPLTRGPSSDAIYLTFDDGPHAEHTVEIAETLEQSGQRATFFFAGASAAARSEIVKRVAAGGHSIGSHSSLHPKPWETGSATLLRDYATGHEQVEQVLGRRTDLFRPPYGRHDPRAALFVRRQNLRLVLWSCDSADWEPGATATEIRETVTPNLGPKAIVLMHDAILDNPAAADRTATVEAVGQLLDLAQQQGLSARGL